MQDACFRMFGMNIDGREYRNENGYRVTFIHYSKNHKLQIIALSSNDMVWAPKYTKSLATRLLFQQMIDAINIKTLTKLRITCL